MFIAKENTLSVAELAKFLNKTEIGPSFIVRKPAHYLNAEKNTFAFFTSLTDPELLHKYEDVLFFCNEDFDTSKYSKISFIPCKEPKVDFFTVVNQFYCKQLPNKISETADISSKAKIGVNVNIGKHTIISDNVTIGNNTYIGNNVTITGDTTIGANCVIKDGAIIGSEGFGFLETESRLMHIPQIGNIIVENDVWIGCNSTVERPSLGTTILKKGCKVDDLVQIGHEAQVGYNSMIAAGAVLAGRVCIGRDCFIGVNVSIREGLSIEDNILVGLGSVVTKNLEKNAVYIGSPARFLKAK